MSRELSPVFVFFFVIVLPLSCCFYRFLTRDDYDAFCHIQNAHAFLSTLGKMQRIKYFLPDHCSVYVPGSTCSERVIIEGYIHKVFQKFYSVFYGLFANTNGVYQVSYLCIHSYMCVLKLTLKFKL